MRHLLLCLAATVALLSACVKAPINGELDGMWQLTRIETSTDTLCQKDVFWSFQLHLVMLGNSRFYGRFEHKGDSLRVYDFAAGSAHGADGNDDDVRLVAGEEGRLKPYGLYGLDTRFKVERMDGEGMRLRSNDACLHFRKY